MIPPGWAHCVINADPDARMVFGAWCDRQYGFEYDAVRARGGLAWFPLLGRGDIEWQPNPAYRPSSLVRRKARPYPELGLVDSLPIYRQFVRNPESVQWISAPARLSSMWNSFEP